MVSSETTRPSSRLWPTATSLPSRQLYDRHAPWLSVRLTRRCNDGEVVADVLQDTFVAAWQGADRYQGRGEVGAWLWGIAIRQPGQPPAPTPRPAPHA